jgi:nucleotide-binding universal stress UspA family protein
MPTTIMVPLDGSAKDGRALAVASALADLAGTGLHLVHVIHASERGTHDSAVARTIAEERLAASADHASIKASHTLTWAVLEGSNVVEALIRHAAECDALAVVMGTRAPSAVGRVMVGSVADRVMRECPKPVVLVPPGAAFMAGKHVRIGRVLVPLDGSALAAKALDFLVQWPGARSLELVLLEVVPPAGAGSPGTSAVEDLDSPRAAEAEARLEVAAARVRQHAAAVEVRIAEAPHASEGIVAGVRDCLVELIAMSTRGAGGLRRLALGSVAEGVVRASEVPVLLLTPATLAAE